MEDWERAARRFAAVHGDALPVAQIKRGHMARFKDALVTDGKAVKTTEKYLAAVSALLEWAVGADLIEVNVGRGIKVAAGKVAPEKRLPYDLADLKRIFGCPIYTQGARPKAGEMKLHSGSHCWPYLLARVSRNSHRPTRRT